MPEAPPPEQLLRQALEVLGYRVSCLAPDLLKAEPTRPVPAPLRAEAGGKASRQALLITCNPAWTARAPGIVLAAPGTEAARRLWQAVAQRGRTAILVAAAPGRAEGLRRSLWFRFVLTVRGFALVEGARRFVIDVWVQSEPEQARVLDATDASSWAALPVGSPMAHGLAALAWVSPYEVRRLGQVALKVAADAARERVAEVKQQLDLQRLAERRRVQRYFDERRAEETAKLGRWLDRACAAAFYARLASNGELSRALRERAESLAAVVRLQRGACEARLAELARERAAALAEVEARYALQARLVPAGMAVVWHAPGRAPGPR